MRQKRAEQKKKYILATKLTNRTTTHWERSLASFKLKISRNFFLPKTPHLVSFISEKHMKMLNKIYQWPFVHISCDKPQNTSNLLVQSVIFSISINVLIFETTNMILPITENYRITLSVCVCVCV